MKDYKIIKINCEAEECSSLILVKKKDYESVVRALEDYNNLYNEGLISINWNDRLDKLGLDYKEIMEDYTVCM